MLTVKQLRAAQPGEWQSDGGTRGAGTLLFRRTKAGGMVAYYRYTKPDGRRDTYPLGQYDESGTDGLTLPEARQRAGELSRLYQTGTKDIRGHFEELETEREAEKAAQQADAEAAQQALLAAQKYTLKALCDTYAELLEGRGKVESARDVRSAFRVHVLSDESLASMPANEVTPDQIADLLRTIREAGKERTAGVLRSYLLSAYNTATRAKFDTALPVSLKAFNVTQNPVSVIPAISVKAGQRALSEDELKVLMGLLNIDGTADQAIHLTLLAAGQRMRQLLAAHAADYDETTGTLRLWDAKGRRQTAREHLLPLGPRGKALAEWLKKRALELAKPEESNPRLFSKLVETTVSKRVADLSAAMGGEPFTLRDLRRTCETLLARLGISRDVRAQLLSHGLSGVQVQHYDRHDYQQEKRSALVAWEQLLSGKPADKVVRIKRA